MAISPNEYRALREIGEKLKELAIAGDIVAMKEIGDRLDGKVPQAQIHMGDEDGGPVRVEKLERIITDPANPDSPGLPAVPNPEPV